MDFNSVLTYYLGVGKHFINTALGVNLTESGSRSVNFDVRGYPSKMMDYISLAKEFTNTHPGGSEGKTRLAGFFANLNFLLSGQLVWVGIYTMKNLWKIPVFPD